MTINKSKIFTVLAVALAGSVRCMGANQSLPEPYRPGTYGGMADPTSRNYIHALATAHYNTNSQHGTPVSEAPRTSSSSGSAGSRSTPSTGGASSAIGVSRGSSSAGSASGAARSFSSVGGSSGSASTGSAEIDIDRAIARLKAGKAPVPIAAPTTAPEFNKWAGEMQAGKMPAPTSDLAGIQQRLDEPRLPAGVSTARLTKDAKERQKLLDGCEKILMEGIIDGGPSPQYLHNQPQLRNYTTTTR